MTTPRIGIIGLGIMGSAMASRLLQSGWHVYGYDVNVEACKRHSEAGGIVCESPADLGDQVDLIIASLPSAAVLEEVLTGPQSLRGSSDRPLLLIEASTLSLEDKVRAHEIAAPHHVALIDCPLSGTGQQARVGDLVAYLSGGTDEQRRTATEAMAPVTRAAYYLGEFGNGTRLKLIANLLVTVHNVSSAEALLAAGRAGLDLPTALTALTDGAGTSRMLEVRGPMMLSGEFEPATMRISTFQKDLQLIAAFTEAIDSPTPLFTVAAEIHDRAEQRGWSESDTAVVFDVLNAEGERGI